MNLIPERQIEQIKRQTDLASLVRSYGISLQKHGKDWIGHCPFHHDKTPSLVVTPIKGLWHCLGACGTGGSVIDFVMKMEKTEFRQAVEILQKRSGMPTGDHPAERSAHPVAQTPTIKRYSEFNAAEREFLDTVFAYYRETLLKSEEAMAYLASRGFSDTRLLQQFGIGYSDGTLHGRFLSGGNAGKERRKTLLEFGYLRATGYEFFHGYITFPLLDANGQVAGMYGRNAKVVEMARKHKYLPGSHRGIFNRSGIKGNEIVLCESVIDALTFYNRGIMNVTCSYGVEGFTDELYQEILGGKIKKVYIAYDSDKAGNSASLKLAEKLDGHGIQCLRVKFPMGMDANEYALKVTSEEFRFLLPEAAILPGTSIQKPGASLLSDLQDKDDNIKTEQGKVFSLAAASVQAIVHTVPLPALSKAGRAFTKEIKGEEIYFFIGEREYRVRSLYKNQSVEALKINLRLFSSSKEEYYIETLDMMNPKVRNAFVLAAAENTGVETEVIRNDLKHVFREIEELLWDYLQGQKTPEKAKVEIPPEEYEKAVKYLQDPDLLQNIVHDFEKCGLVGERVNSLIGYLTTVTRRTENPLAVIVQSSSSAGKSTLMDAILDFVPDEEKEKYSAMTGQSLFYMNSKDLKYKVLAISEEEGMERARYALKILQSEKKISIATTAKDQVSGKMTTMEYTVEGPVVILLTTTNVEIDEELQNRCIVLTVNEDRTQTRAILKIQRELETLDGIIQKRETDSVTTLHKNVQRILRPLAVVNPYARELKFPDTRLRMRRDQKKYLTLIRSIALLFQFQREIKTGRGHDNETFEYIEVLPEDIWLAGVLSARVFGRTLDELSPQTRNILLQINEMVETECDKHKIGKSEYRFGRRQVREFTGAGDTQVKIHLKRLEDLEFLIVHSGKRGQLIEYELFYNGEGKEGEPFLLGTEHPDDEKSTRFIAGWTHFFENKSGENTNLSGVNDNKSGQNANLSGSSRGGVAPKSGGSRFEKHQENPDLSGKNPHTLNDTIKTHSTGEKS